MPGVSYRGAADSAWHSGDREVQHNIRHQQQHQNRVQHVHEVYLVVYDGAWIKNCIPGESPTLEVEGVAEVAED